MEIIMTAIKTLQDREFKMIWQFILNNQRSNI